MKDYIVSTKVYGGNLKGVKESLYVTGDIKMIEFNKTITKEVDKCNLLNCSGIYFLINDISREKIQIYVGQSMNLIKRIKNHIADDKKNFNKIICFLSKSDQFSKTFIDFFEWNFIQKFLDNDYYELINDQKRVDKPYVSDHEYVILEKYIEQINNALFFIGIDVNFNENKNINNDLFEYKDTVIFFYDGLWFLKKGSIIPKDSTINRLNNKHDKGRVTREKALENFKINNLDNFEIKDDTYILKKDLVVSSPSFAACVASSKYPNNGWEVYKNKKNKTLNDIYRNKK